MIKRKLLSVTCALAIGASLIFPSLSMAAVEMPTLHNDNPTANFGDWYTGAQPAQSSSNKPVILFVQGLHSNYSTWTGSDSYYEAAYNAGYRTAFVQLKDADQDGGDMYTNGEVLANVIRKVAAYYNVPKINIIAHSKGGIDTQTALVHYGAAPYVNVVHQLSTPNKGSELADIAYSKWASWLADILEQKDAAVYSLQTSYMANYRAITDSRTENNLTKTYMSGGTGDDGIFTSYWFAHAFLPGEDDGAVAIYSAFGIPYGISSFTKNISHSAMTKASKTWNLVQPKLRLDSGLALTALTSATLTSIEKNVENNSSDINQISIDADKTEIESINGSQNSLSLNTGAEENGNFILRGGEINGTEYVSIPLESGIKSVAFEVMTSKSSTEITLISPSGKSYSPTPTKKHNDPDGIFAKAVRREFQVSKPEAGEWKIKISGNEDAYFAITHINTSDKNIVKANKKVFKKGEKPSISLDFDKGFKGKIKQPKISKSIKNGIKAAESQSLESNAVDSNDNITFEVPNESGVYNFSFDVEGVNTKGEKVVRSINYNFAVTDNQGNIK